MLDKELVIKKMNDRGFVVYATINGMTLQFISDHMYDCNYKERTPLRLRKPIINVIVDLKDESFKCTYVISGSVNTLNCPSCSPVMDDGHFDKMVTRFEVQAKWLSRLEE